MRWKIIVLTAALVVTLLMILFPPTIYFYKETAEQAAKFHFEYMFILSIPEDTRINGILLLSQWFGLLLITAILLSFFEVGSGKSLLPVHDAESDADGDADDKGKEKQEH